MEVPRVVMEVPRVVTEVLELPRVVTEVLELPRVVMEVLELPRPLEQVVMELPPGLMEVFEQVVMEQVPQAEVLANISEIPEILNEPCITELCRGIMRSGKKKGQECGKDTKGYAFCGFHTNN